MQVLRTQRVYMWYPSSNHPRAPTFRMCVFPFSHTVTSGVARTPSWRLRATLSLGAAPFIERRDHHQNGAAHAWFTPMLQAGKHYVACHASFSNIVERVQWARQNDEHVRGIARAAKRFAEEQLSSECTGHALRTLLKALALEMQRQQAMLKRPRNAKGRPDSKPRWSCPSDCIFDPLFA